jgi:hypothetical protein
LAPFSSEKRSHHDVAKNVDRISPPCWKLTNKTADFHEMMLDTARAEASEFLMMREFFIDRSVIVSEILSVDLTSRFWKEMY